MSETRELLLLGRGGGDDLRAGRPTGPWAPDATRPRSVPGVLGVRRLAAESESSDDDTVARAVLLHEICEKAAALADELEEAATRMVVLGEALEMPGQLLDPLRQERDLDFRRSGVTFLGGKPGDDLLLLFPRERHSFLRTRRGDVMSSVCMTDGSYQAEAEPSNDRAAPARVQLRDNGRMPRLDRIYTKTGDAGTTGLGGGQRVPKDSGRVETYGTVDELNSQIGVALATGLCERLAAELPLIQNELFDLGADLATPATSQARHPVPTVEVRHIDKLERLIDEFNDVVGPLTNFLLPGGAPGAAQLHVARTICRRAERAATTLAREETIGVTVLPYLNRLSDALFVMARYENHERGVAEPLWAPGT